MAAMKIVLVRLPYGTKKVRVKVPKSTPNTRDAILAALGRRGLYGS